MLGDDHSVASDKLRVEILWRGKRWREAAWVLARLTGGLDSKNFDEDAAKLMLRRAVALALSDNIKGLAYVRTRFGEAMFISRQAQAFLAVVGKKRPETDSYVVLAKQASELDTFTGFHKQIKAKRKKARAG